MGLWDNIGFKSCPPGQYYSDLMKMCISSDLPQNGGSTVITQAGEVPVKGEENEKTGKFWDKAPDYIDSLANLWAAIKGQPIGSGGNPGSSGGYYPPPKNNDNTILIIGVLILVFILVVFLFFLRRKK